MEQQRQAPDHAPANLPGEHGREHPQISNTEAWSPGKLWLERFFQPWHLPGQVSSSLNGAADHRRMLPSSPSALCEFETACG